MKNALAIERNTASITALTKSFQQISVDFDSVKDELEDLKSRLKEIVVSGFEEIFDEKIKEECDARISGDDALKAQCDTLNTGKAGKVELEAEKIARADADLVLQSRIQAFEGLAARLVNSEASERKFEDGKLDARITSLEGGSGTVTEQIKAEENARIAADDALSISISKESEALTAEINSVSASLSAAVSDLESKDASQDDEIALKATKEELETESAKIAANTTAIENANTALTALATRMTTAEGKVTTLEGVSADLDAVKADLLQAKSDIATVRQMVEGASNRETSHYETLSGRIDSLERVILEYIQR